MYRTRLGVTAGCWALLAAPASAVIITNVVETGGDNEPTDTIVAQWTGRTWTISVANEPIPGAVIGNTYTVGTFGHNAPAYVDRNHRYSNDVSVTPNRPIPSYLVGGDYIMSGNDNRDNGSYRLDVTINRKSDVYMLIDNRLGGSTNGTPPALGPTAMQWILDQGWIPTNNGLNRAGNTAIPDEVAFDEGADTTINQWFSVYRKTFPTGTFALLQADNAGQNMYGVVVTPFFQPGDVDDDEDVDLADFAAIRDNFRKNVASRALGDLNADGKVDFADYRQWKANYPFPPPSLGVPEPTSRVLAAAAALAAARFRNRKSTVC